MSIRRIIPAAILAAFAALAAAGARAETWVASYQFPQGDMRDAAMRSIAAAMEPHGLTLSLHAGASLLRPGDQWAALTSGSVDMTFLPSDYLLEQFPQLGVLSLPGVIRTRDQARRLTSSPPMRELKRRIEAAGVVILAESWIPGVYAGRTHCVVEPADAKGLRARTIGPFMSAFWAGAGAVPVPVTTSDSLGTLVNNGLIDVANTSAATLLSLRMERKFACLTLPGDAGALWYLYEPIMVSKARFDALSESRRQALLAAAAEAERAMGEAEGLLERRLAGNFIAAGVEVARISPAAMDKWVKLARRTAWKTFRERVPGGGDLLDRIQAVEPQP